MLVGERVAHDAEIVQVGRTFVRRLCALRLNVGSKIASSSEMIPMHVKQSISVKPRCRRTRWSE